MLPPSPSVSLSPNFTPQPPYLDEALPALDAAVACLKDLKKADIDEVKSLGKPPAGVVLTMHATCVMFGIKGIKDKDGDGKKFDNYFKAAQTSILKDATALISDMQNYDKDNIPDKIIKQINPFMEDPNFEPKMIQKASKACTAICMWVRAMHMYHNVVLMVEPKKAQLAEAQASLEVTMGALATAQATLKEVS